MSTTKKGVVRDYTVHTYSAVVSNPSALTPEMQSRIASLVTKGWEKTQLNLLDGQKHIWGNADSPTSVFGRPKSLNARSVIAPISTMT